MALIACRECNHEVSDRASRCPRCGAPTSLSAAGKRRLKRTVYTLLTILVVGWAALTTLWLSGRLTSPSQLAGFFRVHDRGSATVVMQAPPVSSTPPSTPQGADAQAPSIYQTSIEQLYQDYNANAVATQTRIGDSRVRVAGDVADINQDASGHPILTIAAGPEARAEMVLSETQRAAVAQLSKGDAVDIQCDHMQRIASTPHGSDCTLALINAGTSQVYLAVFLSSSTGNAPAYVIGPMSQGTCLMRQDSLVAQLNANPKSDRVASRNCVATARENIPLSGCHLSTTMSAIPDVPSAHVWKYDCSSTANALSARKSNTDKKKAAPRRQSSDEPGDTEGPTDSVPQSSVVVASATTPAPPPTPAPTPAPALAPTPTSAPTISPAPAPSTNAIASAADLPASPPSAAAAPARAQPDDLGTVRAADPGAADHIASYCNAATASATDRATVAAGCRHAEANAWTRLVLNNEFPALDDAMRARCNEPPFPDSYVAKESCARYQLHIN
jgi:hypothetical protein